MINARLVFAVVGLLSASGLQAADCRFVGEPVAAAVRFERVASGFSRPVAMIFSPDRPGTSYVVEQYGLIKRVVNGAVQSVPALDMTDIIDDNGNETGLLGLALHPSFAQNRRVFVNYTAKSPLRTRVSEFRMAADGSAIDRASERVILEFPQPYSNHNGGNLAFGPDGYLYIGTGDGGSGGDPLRNGQNVNVLLAKMLRIDVNGAQPYAIPADNPNLGANSRREIYAYGLRNPWRYSFDSLTGELWVGDVGQNVVEEIDVVTKGGNYGWNTMEGTRCYGTASCNRAGLSLPVFEYPRSEGASITGGYVYRGSAIPELIGSYVYGDYVSQKIWALRRNATGPASNSLLADTGYGISSFAEDLNRELYVMDHDSGDIFKIVPATGNTPSTFPRTLSATGCFSSLSPLTPAAGVVPYEVSSELWSDGAVKSRYVKVPAGANVALNRGGDLNFPNDTVLIKNFAFPRRVGGRDVQQLIETRIMIKRADGFRGYSYRWNDARTDAVLLGGATTTSVTTTEPTGDVTFNYYFPSTADCTRCHTESLGEALGFSIAQLNKTVGTGANAVNQLTSLAGRGVIDAASLPGDPTTLPRLANPRDTTAALDARARSYLHVQCAMCHNADEPANQGNFDLRHTVTFADTQLCNGTPQHGDLGASGAKLLKPSDPDKSLVWKRIHSLDPAVRMPPLGSSRLDPTGDRVIADWIRGVASCP